jgi:hypothetical protein
MTSVWSGRWPEPWHVGWPMWEAHRVRRSSGRVGCGSIHAESGEPEQRSSALSSPEGIAAHGAPPTYNEAGGTRSTRCPLHIQ